MRPIRRCNSRPQRTGFSSPWRSRWMPTRAPSGSTTAAAACCCPPSYVQPPASSSTTTHASTCSARLASVTFTGNAHPPNIRIRKAACTSPRLTLPGLASCISQTECGKAAGSCRPGMPRARPCDTSRAWPATSTTATSGGSRVGAMPMCGPAAASGVSC